MPSPFVGRAGTTLTRHGQPFRFTGVNSFVLLGCGTQSELLDDRQLDELFAGLRPASVVRLWLFPGSDLLRFDRIVASARAHGQLVLPTLSDGPGDCGESGKDVGWLRTGYRKTYLPWVRRVVAEYAHETSIAMWDLINEPPGTDLPALRAFIDEVGAQVHALDRHHLVTVGTSLPSEYGGVDGYHYLASSAGIDVLSLHEYDQTPSASGHLFEVLPVLGQTSKPLVIAEFGVSASPTGDPAQRTPNGGTCLSLAQRADLVAAKLRDDLAQPEVAGALYWSYTAERRTDCVLNTTAGDSLLDVIHSVPLWPPFG